MMFLVEPASRDAVLEVLHIMPHWQVDEELSPEGLALRFSYGRKAI